MKLQKKNPDGVGTSHTFTAEILNNFPCKGDDSSQY